MYIDRPIAGFSIHCLDAFDHFSDEDLFLLTLHEIIHTLVSCLRIEVPNTVGYLSHPCYYTVTVF